MTRRRRMTAWHLMERMIMAMVSDLRTRMRTRGKMESESMGGGQRG
jgi:hypothetical protein